MDKIARIRQEIEGRKQSLRAGICNPDAFTRKQKLEMLVASEELDRLNRFLDTLSEEPSKSLQEEIETWIPAHISVKTDETLPINPPELANACKEWGKCIARHFAEWQKPADA